MIPFGTFPLLAAHARVTLPLYLLTGALRLARHRDRRTDEPRRGAIRRSRFARVPHRPEKAR